MESTGKTGTMPQPALEDPAWPFFSYKGREASSRKKMDVHIILPLCTTLS